MTIQDALKKRCEMKKLKFKAFPIEHGTHPSQATTMEELAGKMVSEIIAVALEGNVFSFDKAFQIAIKHLQYWQTKYNDLYDINANHLKMIGEQVYEISELRAEIENRKETK